MTRTTIAALAAALTLAACTATDPVSTDTRPSAAMAAGKLGFDKNNFDTSVRPQDDFYRAINGGWLDETVIPEDKSNYGAFIELHDLSRDRLRVIIEGAAKANAPAGSDAQKVGDFYRSFLDTEAIERTGLAPLAPELARIAAITDVDALLAYFGHAQRSGGGSPFNVFVNQDAKDTESYILYLNQGGLGLPDRDYYFNDAENFVQQRAKYEQHIGNLLDLAGIDDARAKAERIVALETRLASHHWERVRNRDRNAVYNKYTLTEAGELTPGIDWRALLFAADIDGQDEIIIRQPDYFAAVAAAAREVPLADWRAYLQWNLYSSAAPYLDDRFVDENFDFYSRVLRGVAQNRPRWKRGVAAVELALSEVVGKLYVEEHFKPEAKARMEQLVENLRGAFAIAIDDLAWMSDETKTQAQTKLAKFTTKIGYPDKWKDYTKLSVQPDALLANLMASNEVEYQRMLAKLGQPIDRSEWFLSPQTVNAYYNPPMNEIVFPAAILQPPFFNMEADDAVNYGAIVAVIGHEFSHGFDDQGRKSDGDGNLRDWWTTADAAEFKNRADGLVDQYNGYNPIDDMHVNGELTLGENIGDLAGLTMAYKAYRLSLDGQQAPVIAGVTGDQRFFTGWAQVWRRLYRDDELRNRLVTDPHSPSRYRVNGIVSNMPQFHAAFGVKPGDGMYRAADDTTRIW